MLVIGGKGRVESCVIRIYCYDPRDEAVGRRLMEITIGVVRMISIYVQLGLLA